MNVNVNRTTESMTAWLIPITAGLLLPFGILSYSGCKKDEPPPPLPSAAPASTPAAPLALEIEDAGEDAPADAEAGAKKVYKGGASASMKKCCQAVSQNAENAPEPTKSYMKQLAAACFAAASAGRGWSGGGFACK
jgi:hypothetical protein